MELCMFCGNKDLVLFSEHYIFCKDCTAIYTEMELKKWQCGCFDEAPRYVPVVDRYPWFKDWTLNYKGGVPFINPAGNCSMCGKPAEADGW